MGDVAVVVVTYDALPWLERCLSSVSGFSTVVVDHGSRDGALIEGLDALAAGDHEQGLARLVGVLEGAVGESGEALREQIRRVIVGTFNELGNDHPLSREYRRKLASALY